MAREFDTVVVDTSAVVAVFKDEPDARDLAERLESFPNRVISAANFLEAAIVCEKWAEQLKAANDFDVVIATLRLEIMPASLAQMKIARIAHRRFGKGRGKPAVLNFGDCFAYALAKELGAPLLFKGNDFARTDIIAA
jgi:ribonuclease VapC